MPSGAKKRKAAKKKKENQYDHTSSSSSPTHPHGDDDMKQHEDRESDVGENSSPTSQDQQNLPTRKEEEKIPIEREFKIGDELDREQVTALDPKECVMERNGVGLKSPDSSPRASADNDAELIKDSVVTPTVVAPPFPVQKTTWKSCCGLFELFSGSSA